jgi:multiple sugar transport system ATP-binding protein
MADIELRQLRRSFGDAVAVRDIDLTIDSGKFVVLLGPSGCGKTTTLRMIAGLETPTSGQIRLGGRDVTHARPRDRDIAMVFQLFALYPHMTVRQNIAFPLRNEGVPRAAIKRRVADVAEALRIGPLLDSRIGGLSGGDRQRVALGRAIVRQPQAYLMDEPLGTLDAEFRELMCVELRRLHNRLATTTVFVTHDQTEAMALADHIVIMKDGEIQQSDTPERIHRFPANRFVANFIGRPPMNFLTLDGPVSRHDAHVTLHGADGGTPVRVSPLLDDAERAILGVRPDHVRIDPAGPLPARVTGTEFFGSHRIALLDTPAGPLSARIDRAIHLTESETLRLSFDRDHVVLFNAASDALMASRASDEHRLSAATPPQRRH